MGADRGKDDEDNQHRRKVRTESAGEAVFGGDVLTVSQVIGDDEYERASRPFVKRRYAWAVSLGVLAVVGMVMAGGCTVPSSGTPLPASSTASGAGSTEDPSDEDLPSDGAPKVENPLDVSHFEENPCDALKPEDAEALNVPPDGEQTSDPLGENCSWRNIETKGTLAIAFFSEDERGLSSVYREAHEQNWSYFEPIDAVESHPAIAFDPTHDKPTDECSVVVGVTDQLAFMTRVALSDANIGKSDPCALAAKAASMLLSTMQEAA